jgi:hypothetical protein
VKPPCSDPAACTPTVRPICNDPTAPAFLPFILREGPQGCVQGGPPLPAVPGVPAVPAVPDPNNPPPVNAPSPCSLPGTAGCGGTVISIAYDDADLSFGGWFDAETRTFAASLVTKADNHATAFRHTPSV